jgi:penicillin-binding protein 2
VAATPLQLANYVVAVANGGTLYKPRIVSKIKKNSGETIELEPEIIRSGFASANFINVVKEGMRKTVTDGTAQSLKDLPVEVAGKTGTAQFGSEDKTHGWFVSFAPYDNPEIALVILSEGESDGNSSAVPATKEIYEWYFGDKN